MIRLRRAHRRRFSPVTVQPGVLNTCTGWAAAINGNGSQPGIDIQQSSRTGGPVICATRWNTRSIITDVMGGRS